MLVSKFGNFGTQTSSRHHEHKQILDRSRSCTKTIKMRYLATPVCRVTIMCIHVYRPCLALKPSRQIGEAVRSERSIL